jgi:hypothetical protein
MSLVWFLIIIYLFEKQGVEITDVSVIVLGLFYIGDAIWNLGRSKHEKTD